jgi:cation:H+ antiporter
MNFNLSFNQSLILFIISVAMIWYFCTKLSVIVDFIDEAFGLGNAFGGTIILSIVTNLPEIAIIISGSIKGDTSLAVGNILGGVVIQSVLLILFDFAGRKKKEPLSTLTSSKTSILQGLFLIIILAIVIVGKQLNANAIFAHTTVPEILIVIVWIISLFALKKFQSDKAQKKSKASSKLTKKTSVIWLIVISIIVLIFGVLLENASNVIAKELNINGVIFGASILALATSLPEISGGLAFIKNDTYQPIVSDIFGGNAFLPVLFLPATLITNDSILPGSSNIDIYLTAIAIIITAIYIVGMVLYLPKKKYGLGLDSWLALLIYIFSLIGMLYM